MVESLRSIIYFQPTKGSQAPIPRSFLFSGPPGVGKTFSVKKAIDIANSWTANNTKAEHNNNAVHLVSLRGSELLATASNSGGNYATAAKELEKQFKSAVSLCRKNNNDSARGSGVKAVVVFLDECDALVSSSVVAAMLAVILDKMEGVIDPSEGSNGWEGVLVVAATNRIDAIPAFLRRPGRMDKEVVVSPPNVDERLTLLKSMLGPCVLKAIDDGALQKVSESCVGYVAADLSALVRRAAILSIEKKFHNRESLPQLDLQNNPTITANELFAAMNDVGASCLRDASLSAPPKTTWNDIAGDAGGAKKALREAIEWPRTRRSAFKALGLSPPRGVLLHGPPGCAKTTLARAAAGAAGVAFLSLSPADVYASSYVGEAEGIVRRAFDLARSAAPCVLFFDEIDAIIGGDDDGGNGKGGHGMGRGTSAEARVLSTFLNEMDGVDGSVEDGVLVLGATNRPASLDAALMRPGRFDRVIYMPHPDELARKAILTMECTKWHKALFAFMSSNDSSLTDNAVTSYFNIHLLASDDVSGLMTGAEIVGACRETAVQAMQVLMESQSKSGGLICKNTAESLLKSLMDGLEQTLRSKTPLLSNVQVLEEYTSFENERN